MFLKGSLLIFALFFVYTEQAGTGLTKWSLFQKLSAREKPCTQQGLMCDDCDTLVMCYQGPNGEWKKDIAEFCDTDKSCSSVTNSCSTTPDDECDTNVQQYTFVCHQIGVFPHPFDCKKYFICVEENDEVYPEPIPQDCTNGYGYDVKSRLCRKKLNKGNCLKKLVEPCTAVGRFTPIEGSQQLYAICLVQSRAVYFPQLFYCTDDQLFVGTSCVKPASGLDSAGKCLGIGNFYDPNDCKKYKDCSGTGRDPTSKSCSTGYEFHSVNRVCSAFSVCRK